MPEFDLELARQFTVALLIGALVGAEREKSHSDSGHRYYAGLRTFILLSELGAVSTWLSVQSSSMMILLLAMAAVTIGLIAGYVLEGRQRPESLGLSTEFAGLCVFLLGAAVVFGHQEIAIALAVVTAALLAFKQPLHGLVRRIGTDDLYAVLTLLIATFIVLPLLPDETVDPWDALNPYTLWLLVILISGLSLVGYVAVRLLGQSRGTVLTGFAGGMVSSTAVTLSFARQSSQQGSRSNAWSLAAGVVGAWTVMFFRVLITVAVVRRELLPEMLVEFGVLALTGVALTWWFYHQASRAAAHPTPVDAPTVKNPFSIVSAIQFALLFAAMLVVVKLTRQYAPDGGLYLLAVLAGLTDVDAITLSVAQAAGADLPFGEATVAIMLAALANTVTKCAMVVVLGQGVLRRYVLSATMIFIVAGVSAALLSA